MAKKRNTPQVSLITQQDKDTTRFDQKQRVFTEFNQEPFTMKMVAERLGIDRANICWYCRGFRKEDKIKAVKKGYCPITKHLATFLTTNPELFPKPQQLTLQFPQ